MVTTSKPSDPSAPQPALGVTSFNVTPLGTVVVTKVNKFGSAGKAGIVAGDEIVGLNGMAIAGDTEVFFKQQLEATGVGGTLRVRLKRNGSVSEVPVVLQARKNLTLQLDEVSEVLERKISP